jgi:glyoxylase-like metal-dependent hydrolase (beta-lactamase superfamily II)
MVNKAEPIAEGVWRLAGDLRGGMNVFFVRDGDGVIQFDAATRSMTDAVVREGERLGGIKRIVLGHSHADHRGTAPGVAERLGVPVQCHPDEVADAELEVAHPYADFSKIEVWFSRTIYPWLFKRWDGGAVKIDGAVNEGDRVGDFEVVHFPGHAPGLIGLWRESDRLALVSDTVYFVDAARFKRLPPGEAVLPHHAFNKDTEQARASLRKLAELRPATVWAGHAEALEGPSVVDALQRAAD